MIYCIETATGRITQLVHAPDSHAEHYAGDGITVVVSDEVFEPGLAYRDGEAFIPLPEKPSSHHDWDWTSKAWLPNLDSAKAAKKAEIEAALATKLFLPCNGFDADKISRERISGMIARLQRGDGLSTGWVGWRDASNQQQWAADDAATVLANLTALSRAIEEREQSLLIRGWQHKAAIAALADVTSIHNYDTSSGW